VTAFLFLAFALARAAGRRLALPSLLASGLALGLALLAKVSAPFALPVLGLCFAARAAAGRSWARAAAAYALVLSLAVAVLWGAYSFRYHPWPAGDPQAAAKQALLEDFRSRNTPESGLQARAISLAEELHLLPEPYLLSVRATLRHMQFWLSYFLGERTIEGNFLYFPVAFLLKTPLALQLILAATGVALLRRRIRLDPVDGAFLLLFPGLYFASTLFSHLNLGHRYLLPLYPFLFVLAGGIARAWPSGPRRLALAALLAWFAGSSLWIHPDPLTYFNELAGGPRGGIRYLGDSNLDWGQDLKRVGPWMERHGVERVKLAYFGTALPQYYGFAFEWLPSVGFLNDREGAVEVETGDHLVVSATCLQGFYFQDMAKYRFLDDYEPIDVIGNSLYVYHLVPERRRPGRAPAAPARRFP
jgi:4-amino-4-deoxy-L-arabinose transferase-like glycosyltransferase